MKRIISSSLLICLLSVLFSSCESYETWKKDGLAFLSIKEQDPNNKRTTWFPTNEQKGAILYKEITAGTELSKDRPTITDSVKVKYKLSYFNGEVLEAPDKAGKMKVTSLIYGVQVALQNMTVGAKWQLYLHWNQAYGEQGSGSTQYYYNYYGYPTDYKYIEKIKPYSVLIFDIELLEVL